MTLDAILAVFGKETVKQLFKTYILPLFFKDGKFYPKRIILISVVSFIGYLLFSLPDYLPKLSIAFDFYPSLEEIKRSEFLYRLQEIHYRSVIKYLFAFTYIIILLVVMFYILARKSKKTHSQSEERNVAMFAKDVGLIEGARCASKEERKVVEKTISKKIKTSETCRFMLINGYHDLTNPESDIKIALESRKKDLNLKLLLLDPFSMYARKRADKLLPETDEHLS